MPSHTVRVLCEARSQSRSVRDAATGEVPFFWRGSSVVMQLGLVDNGQHLLRAGVGTIIVEVKSLSATSADDSLMRKEFAAAACDATFVAADWTGGAKQLLAASFTLAEAAIIAGTYRLIIRHVAPDESEMTYLSAELRVVDPQAGSEGIDAPPVAWSYLEALPVVRTDITQTLSDAQKSRARGNIGADRETLKAAELRGTDRSFAYRSARYNGGSNARDNLFFFGDSMIGLAKTILTSQVQAHGAISGYGLVNGTPAGGGTTESDACVKWITGETFLLSASGHYVEFAENGSNAVEADTIKVYAYRSPTGGTFKIQLQTNGGAWTDEVTGISTSGTLGSFVTTITKTAYNTNYKVRCVWTSGNPVSIIGCGMRDTRKLGPIVSFATNGSTAINNIDNAAITARAITDPIFADIAPNLIILSHLDGATVVNSSQATLQDNLTAGVTSASAPAPSWLIIGPPIGYNDAADLTRAAQQDAQMALAASRGDSFFDCRTWAMPVSTVVSRGLITDTTHYTTAAQTLWIPMMFRELGLCDGPLTGPSARFSYDIIGGGIFEADSTTANGWTNTGTVHRGFLKIRGSAGGLILEDRAGPANTADMSTIYYDSNVLYVGTFFVCQNNLGQQETMPPAADLNSRLGSRFNRWGVTFTGGISTATVTRTHTSTRTSGVTTNASPNISFASGEIAPVGATITGTNIPGGTTIVSATATTAVMSANATAGGSGITFTIVGATATTATEKDNTFLCNAAGGAMTQPIPAAAAANAGLELVLVKTDSSGNAVTIGGTVSGTVNPTITTQWDFRRIKSDGFAWYRIG
jgi:hypothetical protein